MLITAIAFLLVAILCGVLGFAGLLGAATGLAQAMFFLFLVLFVAAAVARVAEASDN